MIITVLDTKPCNGKEVALRGEGVACFNEGCCMKATTMVVTNVLLTMSEAKDVRVRAGVPLCDKCAEAVRQG